MGRTFVYHPFGTESSCIKGAHFVGALIHKILRPQRNRKMFDSLAHKLAVFLYHLIGAPQVEMV